MALLTTLSQFEQYDLETEICDAVGCQRPTASKIVSEVLVDALESRLFAARRSAVREDLAAAADDLRRMARIQDQPLAELTEDDLTWSRAPEQHDLRRAMRTGGTGALIADWLLTRLPGGRT